MIFLSSSSQKELSITNLTSLINKIRRNCHNYDWLFIKHNVPLYMSLSLKKVLLIFQPSSKLTKKCPTNRLHNLTQHHYRHLPASHAFMCSVCAHLSSFKNTQTSGGLVWLNARCYALSLTSHTDLFSLSSASDDALTNTTIAPISLSNTSTARTVMRLTLQSSTGPQGLTWSVQSYQQEYPKSRQHRHRTLRLAPNIRSDTAICKERLGNSCNFDRIHFSPALHDRTDGCNVLFFNS